MKPSRELDQLVATKVLLWVEDKNAPYAGGSMYPYIRPDGLKVFLPNFSSDIAAAWEVVEGLRARHWRNVISLFGPSDESKLWFCHFEKKWHGRDGSCQSIYDFESGETAPLAICLAALRAVKT